TPLPDPPTPPQPPHTAPASACRRPDAVTAPAPQTAAECVATTSRPGSSLPGAVVGHDAAARALDLKVIAPSPFLAELITYFWWVHWDLPDGVVHDQQVVPQAAMHMVSEADSVAVFGIDT